MFIVLLSNIVNGSNHAKCVSLSHQKFMTQPNLINLHPNEYSQVNVIQINGGITVNVDVSVKNIMYVKKIIFGILLHVVVKMENI